MYKQTSKTKAQKIQKKQIRKSSKQKNLSHDKYLKYLV